MTWKVVSTSPFNEDAIRRLLPKNVEADIVVVTPRDECGARAAVADADVVLGDYTFEVPISRRVIEAMRRCRAILQPSAGFQQIDISAAAQKGIPVTACVGANDKAVAEHTVAVAVALLRELAWTDRRIRAGEWPGLGSSRTELAGKTWGILGFGRTGQEVARHLEHWDVTIMYHDPRRLELGDEERLGVEFTDLDDLLVRADIVSVHVPLLPETYHVLDERRIGLMRSSAYVVNVARGGVVDEVALVDALVHDRLRGAALDVFESEPLPAGHPLTLLDNVILTPHTAGTVTEAQVRILKQVKANLTRLWEGLPLEGVVNGVNVS
ncbi:MAG: NAD(P)-dependent oxidoreductase [Acidimicrobiales bacterium]